MTLTVLATFRPFPERNRRKAKLGQKVKKKTRSPQGSLDHKYVQKEAHEHWGPELRGDEGKDHSPNKENTLHCQQIIQEILHAGIRSSAWSVKWGICRRCEKKERSNTTWGKTGRKCVRHPERETCTGKGGSVPTKRPQPKKRQPPVVPGAERVCCLLMDGEGREVYRFK